MMENFYTGQRHKVGGRQYTDCQYFNLGMAAKIIFAPGYPCYDFIVVGLPRLN